MKQLYLDMNIYNRPFDDQAQVRIRLETIAIHSIIKMIKDKKVVLLWSFMLEFENSLNPYEDIRMEIEILSALASKHIDMVKDILTTARTFEFKGIKSRDAIHLSCAIKGHADYFLTCDDRLIKKGRFVKDKITIMNPIDFIRTEV
jgi:predicted nucleic acid-binding protein